MSEKELQAGNSINADNGANVTGNNMTSIGTQININISPAETKTEATDKASTAVDKPTPHKGTEPFLFISYAQKDSGIVIPIIEQLQIRGVRLWYDAGIDPAENFRTVIAPKIKECQIFVALFSENFYQSNWCPKEFDFAFKNKKKILAIVLDDKPVHDDFDLIMSGNLMIKKSQYQNPDDFYRRILDTDGIDQCLSAVSVLRTAPAVQVGGPQADNQDYLNHFTELLFLEEDDDSKVTLASMYVSPHLISRRTSVADCIMDWFKTKTRKTCMLLFGNAGIGKSSLVSKIVADAYSITQDEDKEFQLSSDKVLAVALRNHCDKIDLTKKADEILMDLFSGYSKWQLKRKLLILDGLDEVCVLRKDFDGHEFLELLLELDQGFHVLVTSRDAKDYFSDPNNIQDLRIETLQWTTQEVRTWCNKYCKAKGDKRTWCSHFIEDYRNLEENENDHRKEAFRVPFILYICGNSEIKLLDHKNIGSIYGDAFRKILSRAHLRGHGDYTNLTKADIRSNLIAWQYTKEIAYQMFLRDTLDLAESNDPDNKYATGLKNAQARTKTVLQEKYGIIVPDDALELKKELALCPFTSSNGTGGITFAHKTVYEYFTAVKLYEDYFANFGKSYFYMTDMDEAAKAVIASSIAAFRYKAIPKAIFQYLCDMHKAPFPNPTGEEFDYRYFEKAFVLAMENRVLNIITVEPPVTEYLISDGSFDPINAHITRALRALICYLEGHGFRIQTDSEFYKQIMSMLGQDVNEPRVVQSDSVMMPYKGNEPYIFISYARKDSDIVLPIITQLQSMGVRLWYDEGITPAVEYADMIAERLVNCWIYVSFLSERFYDSKYCKGELNYAHENNKQILNIYLEDAPMPRGMAIWYNLYQCIYKHKCKNDKEFYQRFMETKGINLCVSQT